MAPCWRGRAPHHLEEQAKAKSWTDTGLIFGREDGQALHPEVASRLFSSGGEEGHAAGHSAARLAAHPCDTCLARRHPPQGRLRTAGPRHGTWWIRQAITRSLANQARTIRLPAHMVDMVNKLIRVQRQLTADMGREPTLEEIAAEMDTTPAKVREILKISQDPVSLETPIGEEHDSQLGDFIEDEDATMPEEAVGEILRKEELDSVLSTLTYRERKIIELRFGLNTGYPRTFEEVGQEFSLTRERIRQIEAKTLAKLTSYRDSQRLQSFLE